eukprot:4280572-Alexandrium_andersonii.AAC.1
MSIWGLLAISGPVMKPVLWNASLLLCIHGGLQRIDDVNWDAPAAVFITADASPWGTGGILQSTS